MPVAPAPDDIVASHAEAERNERAPLLVVEPLRAFLDERGLGSGDLDIEPVGEGHSNVTYLVRRGDREVVVRRPPRPPLPPSAHDVLREARLLRALAGTSARVPAVLAVCGREAVLGAPFYVMERLHGEVIATEVPAALDAPDERRRMAEELVDALAEIHAVDWRACLEGFGKPSGYLERQVRRFGALWEHNRTRDVRQVERVGAWLAEHLPESGPATTVHAAFRLGNTMFAPEPPARLIAVFDWEMATIGDPLADGCYLCMTWGHPGPPPPGPLELPRRPPPRALRARPRHARRGLPDPRRARRPLRGALGAAGRRPALVHRARAVEVDRLHGGQLPPRDRGAPRRPVPQVVRRGRARARRAGRADRVRLRRRQRGLRRDNSCLSLRCVAGSSARRLAWSARRRPCGLWANLVRRPKREGTTGPYPPGPVPLT